jgi:hypothetical protein
VLYPDDFLGGVGCLKTGARLRSFAQQRTRPCVSSLDKTQKSNTAKNKSKMPQKSKIDLENSIKMCIFALENECEVTKF